jgi:hypothetical protein
VNAARCRAADSLYVRISTMGTKEVQFEHVAGSSKL